MSKSPLYPVVVTTHRRGPLDFLNKASLSLMARIAVNAYKHHIYVTSAVSLNSSSACHAIIKQEIGASFASFVLCISFGIKGVGT